MSQDRRCTGKLLDERRTYAAGLRSSGMSMETIVKLVNNMDSSKYWGTVTRRTVERDIVTYFRDNQAMTVEDYDYIEMMRAAHLEQMERTIERMHLHINNKKEEDWKPFEKMAAMESLHKAQMNYAEVKNWNKGRLNVNVSLQQNNINTVFEAANTDLAKLKKNTPAVMEALIGEITNAIDKMKEQGERNMMGEDELSDDPVVIEAKTLALEQEVEAERAVNIKTVNELDETPITKGGTNQNGVPVSQKQEEIISI